MEVAGISPIQDELTKLRSLGLDGFDSALFSFIESLVNRAANLPRSAQLQLEDKAAGHLQEFHRRRAEYRQKAASILENVEDVREKGTQVKSVLKYFMAGQTLRGEVEIGAVGSGTFNCFYEFSTPIDQPQP